MFFNAKDRSAEANASVAPKLEREQVRRQAKEIKQLEAELRRKEKALAEAAALLVLQKKVQALWGEPEDARSSGGSAER